VTSAQNWFRWKRGAYRRHFFYMNCASTVKVRDLGIDRVNA
jgi:hypothetical protein